MGIGHMLGTVTCALTVVVPVMRGTDEDGSRQDCQLLLQEHHLYRGVMVVHDLLFLE